MAIQVDLKELMQLVVPEVSVSSMSLSKNNKLLEFALS